MYTKLHSGAIYGINGMPINIEVNITTGLPKFEVVGLADQAVSEARERVIAAIRNSDRNFPSHRIVINLAPANIKKSGSCYDLAFAVGILVSSAQIYMHEHMKDAVIFGELALDGSVRSVKGLFPMLVNAHELGIKKAIIPKSNIKEAELVEGLEIYPVNNLFEAIEACEGKYPPVVAKGSMDFEKTLSYSYDFADVKGQEYVKRAATVAAAGGHNFIMVGSPGSGKTLVAKCIPSILPPLSFNEAIELTKIYSTQGLLSEELPLVRERPFRSPHHTASYVSMVGGGHNVRAGEVSLSHHGILFLDEFAEFQSSVLQTLREPMEERFITISRAQGTFKYPANFTLIAAMNPCPCGFYGDKERECICSDEARKRYVQKLSGPILDRIDIALTVKRVEYDKLTGKKDGLSSKEMKEKVCAARNIQKDRFKKHGMNIYSNSMVGIKEIEELCMLTDKAKETLDMAARKLLLSARTYDKTKKIARTVADLDGKEKVQETHIFEALQYRNFMNAL